MKMEKKALAEKPSANDVTHAGEIQYRNPRLADGAAIWGLVEESQVLDSNSIYLYLLLCHHFSDTCFVGEYNGKLVAFLSAYMPPGNPGTIFVWQIAVHKNVRRQGVALTMLDLLVDKIVINGTAYVEATISPSNRASRKLFRSLAAKHEVACNEDTLFTKNSFGNQAHEDEVLFRLGPFNRDYKPEVDNENF